MASYKIISTKKISPTLKEEAMRKGIEVIEKEFIQIKPVLTEEKHIEVLQWNNIPESVAVAFTSQHAVENVVRQNRFSALHNQVKWKIFCIEGKTQEMVKEYLPSNEIIDTALTAGNLAKKIIANGSFKKVIFFCGNKRRDELPQLLKENGIEVTEVIVYETIETPEAISNEVDGVLFFSPSAVNSFFSVNNLPEGVTCFAIGPTTAQAISEHTGNRVIVSDMPDQEILINMISRYFQHNNNHQ